MVTPFHVAIDQARLDDIARRIAQYEWQEAPIEGGWGCGADLAYMKDLVSYWQTSFDWRKSESALNQYPQFTADVEDITLHFYHVKAKGGAQPGRALLLSHGWPGSVFEFLHLIGPLTDPIAFGGQAEDAFDVIIPSLPGYGFSSKPKRPIGPRRIAHLFNHLVTQTLGYSTYIAQGGDWGSVISAWAGFDHGPACRAVHLNMVGVRPTDDTPKTDDERKWSGTSQANFRMGGSYFLQHATKPLTLSYAMMDSPVGAAAWIIEKFHAWSDIKGDIESRFTKDQLLTNIMIYLTTRTFQTATWLYRGVMEEGSGKFPDGRRVEVPVAVADFPGDTLYAAPPRSFAERAYNIARWTKYDRGGHFAALEEPDLFLADIRDFARSLRP
jgi:microsomal epoxide hydrolase